MKLAAKTEISGNTAQRPLARCHFSPKDLAKDPQARTRLQQKSR